MQVLLRARTVSQPCSAEPGARAGSLDALIAMAQAGAQRSCRPSAPQPGLGTHLEPPQGLPNAGIQLQGAGLDAEERDSQLAQLRQTGFFRG